MRIEDTINKTTWKVAPPYSSIIQMLRRVWFFPHVSLCSRAVNMHFNAFGISFLSFMIVYLLAGYAGGVLRCIHWRKTAKKYMPEAYNGLLTARKRSATCGLKITSTKRPERSHHHIDVSFRCTLPPSLPFWSLFLSIYAWKGAKYLKNYYLYGWNAFCRGKMCFMTCLTIFNKDCLPSTYKFVYICIL